MRSPAEAGWNGANSDRPGVNGGRSEVYCKEPIVHAWYAGCIMRIAGAVLLITALALMTSCNGAESNFFLASASRLPKWFTLPPGVQRKDVLVRMDYYIKPEGRSAVFTLYEFKKLRIKKVVGEARGLYPSVLKDTRNESGGSYPAYEVITVNGVTDIVEHRHMEPIFYMADDPRVWRELGIPSTK